MTGTTILLRRSGRGPVDPLIKEARERQHRRRRRIAASLVLIGTVSAFSFTLWARSGQAGIGCTATSNCGATAASPVSGLPNPCALLTSSQVVQALGSKLAYRIPHQSSTERHCTWNTVPLTTFTSAEATLTVIINRSTEAQFRRSEKSARSQGSDLAPVRGVGDLAYWTPNSPVTFLTVWADGYDVTLSATTVVSPLKVEKALAVQALKSL
jgi:hypothetical protein